MYVQAPMRKYAGTLAEKAARQRALRSTGEMTLEAQQEESEESEDDMEALPMDAIMPQVNRQSRAAWWIFRCKT